MTSSRRACVPLARAAAAPRGRPAQRRRGVPRTDAPRPARRARCGCTSRQATRRCSGASGPTRDAARRRGLLRQRRRGRVGARAGRGGAASTDSADLGGVTAAPGTRRPRPPRRSRSPPARRCDEPRHVGERDPRARHLPRRSASAGDARARPARRRRPASRRYSSPACAADELLDAIASLRLASAAPSRRPGRRRAPGPTGGPAAQTWTLALGGGAEPAADAHGLPRRGRRARHRSTSSALVCVAGPRRRPRTVRSRRAWSRALASAAAAGAGPARRARHHAGARPRLAAWRARIGRACRTRPQQRAVAAYAPWLRVRGLTQAPRRTATCPHAVGHVCGVIARLDRERGVRLGAGERARGRRGRRRRRRSTERRPGVRALRAGVNLLRCAAGGGLEVWGARTLDPSRRARTSPTGGSCTASCARSGGSPSRWSSTATGPSCGFTARPRDHGVLLEAFRSGALRGDTPDQAYRVRCDDDDQPARGGRGRAGRLRDRGRARRADGVHHAAPDARRAGPAGGGRAVTPPPSRTRSRRIASSSRSTPRTPTCRPRSRR